MYPVLYCFLMTELLIVSYFDLKYKSISNLWHIFNFFVFLLLFFLGKINPTLELLILPLTFLILGFILFIYDIMGAGDSKFLAFFFLLIPNQLHFLFLELLLYSTIVVGSVFLIFRLVREYNKIKIYLLSQLWLELRNIIKSEFSYAPVILLSWMLLGFKKWVI